MTMETTGQGGGRQQAQEQVTSVDLRICKLKGLQMSRYLELHYLDSFLTSTPLWSINQNASSWRWSIALQATIRRLSMEPSLQVLELCLPGCLAWYSPIWHQQMFLQWVVLSSQVNPLSVDKTPSLSSCWQWLRFPFLSNHLQMLHPNKQSKSFYTNAPGIDTVVSVGEVPRHLWNVHLMSCLWSLGCLKIILNLIWLPWLTSTACLLDIVQ